MTNVLQRLLGRDDSLFLSTLEQLEQSIGNEGIDTRLIGDITDTTHNIVKNLGLDSSDSSAVEVYHALRGYVGDVNHENSLLTLDYVLYAFHNEVVSFNLIDLMEDIRQGSSFEQRSLSHGRRALLNELIHRYIQHPRSHENTIRSLVGSIVETPQVQPKPLLEEKKMQRPYILAIGDIFTDAFIKLNEEVASVYVDEKGEKRLSLPLGSKPPYDGVDIIRAVGPGPNAAVAIARLGLHAGLDSFIGDDEVGNEAVEQLNHEGIDTSTMLIEKGIKTNYYFVLRYGAERTILVKNEQFDYTWAAPSEEPDWIYLALISDASWTFHESLLQYLEEHPNVKLAFQPGTFHFKWGVEKLAGIYKRSTIIVLNREEAADVTGRSVDSIRDLAIGLHELGPEKVVITDGPNGSYASFDYRLVTIPNYPDVAPPLDRTGAGDAFAATIVAALALGETMDTALMWAPINSASVVQKLGAQAGLLRRDEIEHALQDAPDWYKVSDFEG